MLNTDIDIDFQNPEKALEKLPHIKAITTTKTKHPSSVYFQNVPVDIETGLCAYNSKEALEHNFFKIDFLKNSIYDYVHDEEHLDRLLNQEPLWELFEQKEIVQLLSQVSEHHHILIKYKPKSIEELAIVIALIRPGKRYLLNKTKQQIDKEIWLPTKDGSYFYKKSHAIAYAASIVVQLNLLVERMNEM